MTTTFEPIPVVDPDATPEALLSEGLRQLAESTELFNTSAAGEYPHQDIALYRRTSHLRQSAMALLQAADVMLQLK